VLRKTKIKLKKDFAELRGVKKYELVERKTENTNKNVVESRRKHERII
jgi:hypothetical protein